MRLISAVTCEDIRFERDGKATLVGVGNGSFSYIKGAHPRPFALWAIFQADEGENVSSLYVKAVCNRGHTHFTTPKIKMEEEGKKTGFHTLNLKMPYQPILHDGTLEFFWSFDKDEWHLITTISNENIED